MIDATIHPQNSFYRAFSTFGGDAGREMPALANSQRTVLLTLINLYFSFNVPAGAKTMYQCQKLSPPNSNQMNRYLRITHYRKISGITKEALFLWKLNDTADFDSAVYPDGSS